MKRCAKSLFSLLLCLVLLCAALPVFASAATTVLSPQKLTVDGKSITCEKYNIDGSNYFKLRDLAYLLNGTAAQFSVSWDETTGTVGILTGGAYVPDGSELDTSGGDKSATAVPSSQTIRINDVLRSDLSVYNIGGNNYFKLRDLGKALDFFVDYDQTSNTAVVESVKDPLDFSGSIVLQQFLTGTWLYYGGPSDAPAVSLTLSADGQFTAYSEYQYTGTWKLEHLYSEANEMPDLLCLSLTDTTDPTFQSWSSIGDFILDRFTVCDGGYTILAVQANNGDSLFSIYHNDFTPALVKYNDTPMTPIRSTVKANASFYAVCWKQDQADSGAVTLWLDDVEGTFYRSTGHNEAVPYVLAPGASVQVDLAAVRPGYTALSVETDANGAIRVLKEAPPLDVDFLV
ncbi:MAG: hypothetical protein IKD96_01500 [Oscillospiraceae bacterium]|nr:hypothetical protein [Oscillospiraceae bacterium]